MIEEIMHAIKDALNLGHKTLIGLDIGLSSVKMSFIESDGRGNYILNKYASVDLPEASIVDDEIQKEEEVVEALRLCLAEINVSTNLVNMGLSGPNTIARKIQLAGGTKDEIAEQVEWEAEQYLPFPIEESSMSFHILGDNEGGGVDVLVCAARSDILLNYKDLIESAELRASIVDLNLTAITNVFELIMGSKLDDPEPSYMILDFGAQKTECIIYKKRKIQFTKEMNIGGIMITEEIQRQLGVNYDEAEDLKTTGDENGNLPEEVLEIIDDVAESFFSEIKKTIDFYVSSTSDESLIGCYITGGGAMLPGLLEGLEALLGVDVSIMNPFEVFEYNEKYIPKDMINSIAYRGVVVLGLGMREVSR
jgi:type IV pilus assembly protein PilM